MAKTGVEEHEAVEVGVVGVEEPRLVEGMVVVDVGADFHLVAESAFDDCAEGVAWCALGEGEFGVAVGHAFGTNEDEVEGGAGEHVGELDPDFAGKGRFGPCAEDEDADGRWIWAEAFDVETCAGAGWVEGVAESCRSVSGIWWGGESRQSYRSSSSGLQS